ncbi:sugar ABC transporter substrate-binding protein [Paenibacillus baekrokdamisoli]|uniref:Sugar ABC transporter substrate-binding protein n=1 Tax=Paenibacillus baekrokdamisoli TaxID=1712516 RepID=A0A3G9IRS5_9BACL|nr:extracellular solute-binding protein [Paenibacillus baekrokdamisoli]MBB3071141.1 putative aldouronate transport system substrate-binding protein [Paenibacillus baekrokdamisoli]BBH21560.1 sugar ABC transporter substrate-binding protein [Paenibacillus baekrokdamisoli]
MKRMSRLALSCILVIVLAVLSGCGGSNTNKEAVSPPTGSTTPAEPDVVESTGPVEITMARESEADVKYLAGETIDKNSVSDAIVRDTGITIKNVWVAETAQYEQKVQMSISSNDIPDLMAVTMPQLQQLTEADMIMDLTDLYEKDATPETKAYLTGDGGKQMDSAKHEGKLMAIPQTNGPYGASTQVWIRRDWLKKLNLPEPKTMQDVLAISAAFAKKDPGGTGKSYGLPLTKDFLKDVTFDIRGFFNSYHAYPTQWIKDSSGKLVSGDIQPEMKQALKQLQDMYKDGQIDPEFAVKDLVKENELLASNKVGVVYGPFWLSAYPLFGNAVKDGKLVQDWWPYPIASIDDKPALSQIELGVQKYYVVSKKAKHPEAAIKLLNKWVQAYTKPTDTDKVYFLQNNEAASYYKLSPIRVFSQTETITLGDVVPKAVLAKDPSTLTGLEAPNRYGKIMKYLGGDTGEWAEYPISGPNGAFSIMYDYLQKDLYHFNEFYGAQGTAMLEKKPVLDAKMSEIFIKIIMNQVSIDEFDKFVEEWKKLGGDEITAEVNAWFAAASK